MTPRFVVGTGRCGSTLLSRMLSENREVLNVFELFSGIDQFFRFRRDPVDGRELAAVHRVAPEAEELVDPREELEDVQHLAVLGEHAREQRRAAAPGADDEARRHPEASAAATAASNEARSRTMRR